VRLPRAAGILLHPASLPSGRLDDDAYRFVDWLADAGISWWQVLPLGPPDEAGSPYRAASAFAGWRGFLADPDARVSARELDRFVARHPYWIGHWAAYAGEDAVADQVRFQREWEALRAHAAARGIRIVGDVPIYVAPGGADHLSHPELFQRGVVAGVPPDDFSASGQLWGNPIYDWATLRATGFRWWIERFRRTFELVDLTRVDHFRGFVAYWAVPEGRKTARRGTWRRVPGRELFEAVRRELGDLPLIAEDLGVITPAVERLRDALGLPGTLVLQFGFGEGARNPHRFDVHPEHRVVYTGTHDNDTALGWWRTASDREQENFERALASARIEEDDVSWAFVRLALASRARLAIVPLQDVLGLGSGARMNTPGSSAGNWRWRVSAGALTPALAARLRAAAAAAGRIPEAQKITQERDRTAATLRTS
jgi:4-alpha-glucanotransferase